MILDCGRDYGICNEVVVGYPEENFINCSEKGKVHLDKCEKL